MLSFFWYALLYYYAQINFLNFLNYNYSMTIALTPFNLDGMDRLEATHISTNLCYFLLASLEKKR